MGARRMRVLAVVFVMVFSSVICIGNSNTVKASISGVYPPGSGDWDITSPTVVINESIEIDANLIVESTLDLENTTLMFDCQYNGQHGIDVLDGGHLIVKDVDGCASNITSYNSYAYTFRIRSGAEAELINSEIHKCGYYPNQIDYRCGLSIESSNVMIQGCAITDNYIGILFNESVNSMVTSSSDLNTTYMTAISNNSYGIYMEEDSVVDFEGTDIYNNTNYNMYLEQTSQASMTDCLSIPPETIGGSGTIEYSSSNTDVYNTNDYFEIGYDSDSQTARYDGWLTAGSDHYANSYCVLRRGHDYNIKTNPVKMMPQTIYNALSPYWLEGGCGYSFGDIEYPITPVDSTNLLSTGVNGRYLSIPSDYPISHCTLIGC